jgi:glycosyltransferase involved in cell wall biosynthesis
MVKHCAGHHEATSGEVAFLLITGKDFGGMELRFARLISHLMKENENISLYCTADARNVIDRLGIKILDGKCHVLDFPSGSSALLRKVFRLFGLFRFFVALLLTNIRQVHFAFNPGWLILFYSYISHWLPKYSFSIADSRLGFSRKLLRKCIRNAVAVDCLSHPIKTYAESACIVVNDKDKIVGSPCSFSDYSKVVHSEKRDIDVAMIARFSKEKGYDLLADAISGLGNVNVHACGFGDLPPEMPNARIYKTDSPYVILARSKIFVSLQKHDNYPSQSLLEAMASGCAIIATDVGETRRLLDESCAILIPPNSMALKESILFLLSDSELRRKLGASACQRVHATQTVERYASYFVKNIILDSDCQSKVLSSRY